MNELDKLIAQLIKEEGGTKQQYLHLLKEIANHETGGSMDPLQKQIGGGPGRGKYQFEIGKNKGGITAARRLKTYYTSIKKPVPQWLNEVTKNNDLDASTLTDEQQDLLFLGNMKGHPRADLAKVMNGEESVPDFWANYHWAGKSRDRDKRIKNFKDTYTEFKPLPVEYEKNIANIDKKKDAIIVSTPYPKIFDIQSLKPQTAEIPKEFALGGQVNGTAQYNNLFNSFNVGGSHESNPNGGIPLGIGNNGKPNTVEQGEASYNFKDGKFIFSNRIKI